MTEFDYTVKHRPGRLHSNADGLFPFSKQCIDQPSPIPWVDEIDQADDVVGPWSVHTMEVMPYCPSHYPSALTGSAALTAGHRATYVAMQQ